MSSAGSRLGVGVLPVIVVCLQLPRRSPCVWRFRADSTRLF
ncbi:hypothetical protein SynM161_00231 [Synechococcus sp. M16.1]|nr:hypothetical protein SynM161_00231 [Synechococcus sp. M16.1]